MLITKVKNIIKYCSKLLKGHLIPAIRPAMFKTHKDIAFFTSKVLGVVPLITPSEWSKKVRFSIHEFPKEMPSYSCSTNKFIPLSHFRTNYNYEWHANVGEKRSPVVLGALKELYGYTPNWTEDKIYNDGNITGVEYFDYPIQNEIPLEKITNEMLLYGKRISYINYLDKSQQIPHADDFVLPGLTVGQNQFNIYQNRVRSSILNVWGPQPRDEISYKDGHFAVHIEPIPSVPQLNMWKYHLAYKEYIKCYSNKWIPIDEKVLESPLAQELKTRFKANYLQFCNQVYLEPTRNGCKIDNDNNLALYFSPNNSGVLPIAHQQYMSNRPGRIPDWYINRVLDMKYQPDAASSPGMLFNHHHEIKLSGLGYVSDLYRIPLNHGFVDIHPDATGKMSNVAYSNWGLHYPTDTPEGLFMQKSLMYHQRDILTDSLMTELTVNQREEIEATIIWFNEEIQSLGITLFRCSFLCHRFYWVERWQPYFFTGNVLYGLKSIHYREGYVGICKFSLFLLIIALSLFTPLYLWFIL